MSGALRKPMTMPEFLDWEQRQPTKHEFDGMGPVAMAGGTAAHARLQRNLTVSISSALRGSPCEFFGSDFQLRLEMSVRYPDGTVVCDDPKGSDLGTSTPVVVFEVLSPSTAGIDRIVKAREYQATPSVQRYVMLEQDRVAATVFARRSDGWSGQVLASGDTLMFPELGISMPLDELYIGVALPEMPDGPA